MNTDPRVTDPVREDVEGRIKILEQNIAGARQIISANERMNAQKVLEVERAEKLVAFYRKSLETLT